MALFEHLKHVFSRGGEIATGLGVFYDWGESRLRDMLGRRFGVTHHPSQTDVITFATQGVAAGGLIDASDPTFKPDLNTIPINPYLFGDDSGGRRGRYVGEFQFDPEGRWYRVDIDVADFNTIESLHSYITDKAFENIANSPGAFGVGPGVVPVIGDIRVVFVERRF